ncbi:MAG TPA: helix-turn-helix transcriptional regulator [Verrucomicrobiae bacterium]|nr:helix-turn-helix transcriptional regulator [Verrucomicrobiae bacterium]
MGNLNIIGPVVIKLRFERGWSQEILAARLQCQAEDISRDVLANIETGRTQVTDKHIQALQKVFGVQIARLFPPTVQELDEKLAGRNGNGLHHPKKPNPRRHYFRR